MTTTYDAIAAVVAAADFGQPSAVKRGSNPDYPYVPLVRYADGRTRNPARGRAFATRDEAVDYAARMIDSARDLLARNLAEPGWRSLREQYGLPRELPRQETAS